MAYMNILLFIGAFIQIATTEQICPGFGKPELSGHNQVDSSNIHLFKNCNVIDGYIRINRKTFEGSQYQGIQPIHPFQLEVFNSVREITGYLFVSHSGQSQEDLSAFRNLETIGGNTLSTVYSLVLKSTRLQSLGLDSLRSIQNGDVYIRRNYRLCYVKSEMFANTGMFQSYAQRAEVTNNSPTEMCIRGDRLCHEDCGSDLGCMGPRSDQCATCKLYHIDGRCVDNCNASGLYLISEESKECGYIDEGSDNDFELEDNPEFDDADRAWSCSNSDADICLDECQEVLIVTSNENTNLRLEVESLRLEFEDLKQRYKSLQNRYRQAEDSNTQLGEDGETIL